MAPLARVTAQPLDLAEHLAAVEDPSCGAVVVFVGRVRDRDPQADGPVVAIEYSAHPDAERVLRMLAARAASAGARVAVSHRVGRLAVGEVALLACVATPHRAEAHRLSEDLVAQVKATLPVWKRQVEADGRVRWAGV
jgi:molybdopterin synthase catalytic subunit